MLLQCCNVESLETKKQKQTNEKTILSHGNQPLFSDQIFIVKKIFFLRSKELIHKKT